MPRPCKFRFVEYYPQYRVFYPANCCNSNGEEIILTFDELEAIRLADFEGLYQEDSALKMNISRQTFGNIISSARKKVADFILNGKILKIEGGKIMAEERIFKCSECGNDWSVPFGEIRPKECPNCKSQNFHRLDPPRGRRCGFGRGMGQKRGGRRMGYCERR